MIGSVISHYKILDKLGEGGMGVVYKALDTRLDRVVALKFMPHHITPDESEAARFLQEAKAASALNHPNVCTIYGIHDEGGQTFIEMEFVEGVTLRHKLPVHSLAEAIGYGVQTGDALHEAHLKGIVHRDIKADNIMINSKNQIKVMDFGLAKLKGSLKLTKTTSTVGTLAYMAPEQIQGGDVDARSDIFSFGVVLYEMLSGKLPFRNEHEAALMYSILNDEPEPIQKYRDDVSPVLLNLIQRALEKNPDDRYQSINEMVIELRRLQKQSAKVSRASLSSMPAPSPPAGNVQPPSGAPPAPARESGKKRSTFIYAAAAAALILAGAALWYLVLKPSPRSELNPAMSFRELQTPFPQIGYPSLSRDGAWVLFAAQRADKTWDVYMMNSTAGEPRQITTDSSGFMQTAELSPDGSQVVYDRADKDFSRPEIGVVPSLGGPSKRIATLGYLPHWSPDGQRVGYVIDARWGARSGKTEFRSVRPNGTDDRLELIDSAGEATPWAWSPRGDAICMSRRDQGGHFELFIRDLATKKDRQLTFLKKQASYVAWTKNDEIVFSCDLTGNVNLWIMPSSGGTPVQVTRGSGMDIGPTVSADQTRLLYEQQKPVSHIWVGSFPEGTSRELTAEDIPLAAPDFSPDGRKIVYVQSIENPRATTTSLMVLDRTTNSKNQLLSEETNIHDPRWSPDGKWIAYAAHPDTVQHDSSKLYILDVENSASAREIGAGFPMKWLDASSILVTHGTGTWIIHTDGSPPTRFFRDSTVAEPVLGGSYVLYRDVVMGRRGGVWLEPLAASGLQPKGPVQLLKTLSPSSYVAAMQSLLYLSPQSELRRVHLPDGRDEKVPGLFPQFGVESEFSVSPDGKWIVYLDSRRVSKLMLIDNLH